MAATVFAYTEDRSTYNATYHDATSTGFQLKGGAGDPAVGRSTSTNYILDNGLVIEFGVMTITVATSVNFGVLTPLIPSQVTSSVVVDMVGALNGYNITIKRDSATSTMDQNAGSPPDNPFPDATDWNSSGSGNGATTPGNNLSFRVMQAGTNSNYDSTWWGASDASGTAKYAGFPVSMQQIMNCSTCNFGSTDTIIGYRASPPVTQQSGDYSGTITITALVNP
ncbi:MAG: hypothetical protein NTW66_01085 [Candidatus Magasanikbacteria bacterium]|nr:hypothetical protein [Candidatus Magasanikbacteria bacterium]